MSLLLLFRNRGGRPPLPGLVVKALLEFGDRTPDGRLVEAVSLPWFHLLDMVQRNPDDIYQIDAFKLEEVIAGAYKEAGFDEVILTPRSGDLGRDVIASKRGLGCIRIFDQVKAYKPGHVVPANDVRAMLGVITGAQNVSKGVITTTATFAPKIEYDPILSRYIPYRLELKPRDQLLKWLDDVRKGGDAGSGAAPRKTKNDGAD